MQAQYTPDTIEIETQTLWQERNTFQTTEDINQEKYYVLAMFPYPSGSLHIGHVRNYTIADVIARQQRMLGKNVLQPMGWDAFGLPAENAAIKNKIPPAKWTRENIATMRTQMQRLGLGYDWSREITTCDPDYYRWEQWFFTKLFEKGLVYKKLAEVNWDPVDQTVLANEQVINGRGWRSDALVERREIPQWYLKITDYAEELLNDLSKLTQWPEQVRTMQKHWIGRSEGAEIQFTLEGYDPLTIYTTRPDTLFGVTYLALAPQHPITKKLAETNPELNAFVESCRNTKVAEAELATMEKRGMPLNIHAIHPFTGERIPVWVANFVLMDYGAGALMAVPAHDQRDHEFAVKYHLPIIQVIESAPNVKDTLPYTGEGVLIRSGEFTNQTSSAAIPNIIQALVEKGIGERKVNYRLRDWSVSRQRYWGAPIPIINCKTCGAVPVPEKDLPVVLPEDVTFTGVASPLKSMPEFLNVPCPQCGEAAERETDTFDTFMESSWYYARFACKKQPKAMLDGRANYWVPVDQYVGGIEHAVLHLLYARFFHKLMRDEGLLNSDEPFTRLLTQGMVLNQGVKMSKSKGNVVAPNVLIEKYGVDTVRLFLMFAAPPEQNLEWSDSGVEGAHRFLKRLWAFAYEHHQTLQAQNKVAETHRLANYNWEAADDADIDRLKQIFDVLDQIKYDYERQQFNTVVSGCMKIFNTLLTLPKQLNEAQTLTLYKGMSVLLRLLAPITPHITHQLWQDLGYPKLIIDAEWPKASNVNLRVDSITLVVQVNGKLRSRIRVPHQADAAVIEAHLKADEKVQQALQGLSIKKIITVPGKLVNVVAGA
ncbi:MAG TPA: leucine--tRNA ligase [Gammaproteobacteria bacterium]|jgi:leucyl-tRNA synthetase|nr:leucine--tRNA ligase [Gammaproteobacteria bacterium]